jgi:hypothetical protein
LLKLWPVLFIILCLPRLIAHAQELAELSNPPNGDNQKAEVSQWNAIKNWDPDRADKKLSLISDLRQTPATIELETR